MEAWRYRDTELSIPAGIVEGCEVSCTMPHRCSFTAVALPPGWGAARILSNAPLLSLALQPLLSPGCGVLSLHNPALPPGHAIGFPFRGIDISPDNLSRCRLHRFPSGW